MLHKFGCILWIAWLVRWSFATSAQLRSIERSIGLLESEVKADRDSVSAGGHTFSSLQSEALNFAAGFAHVPTTLQARTGFLESKAKEHTDSVSAGVHTVSNMPREALVQSSLSSLVETETETLQAQIGFLESKVKEETDSVSADGHTFSTLPRGALAQSSLPTTLQDQIGPLESKVKKDTGSVSAGGLTFSNLPREALVQLSSSPKLQARIGSLESKVKDGHTSSNLPREALVQSSLPTTLQARSGPLESKVKADTNSVSAGGHTSINLPRKALVQSSLSTTLQGRIGPLDSKVKADVHSVSAGGHTSTNLPHKGRIGPLDSKVKANMNSVTAGGHTSSNWSSESLAQSSLSTALQGRIGHLESQVKEGTNSVSASGHTSSNWASESLVQSSLSAALQGRIGHLESHVKEGTDSVSAGGRTSSNWSSESLVQSSLSTALKGRIGHLESKVKEGTDSVSAGGHTFNKQSSEALVQSSLPTALQARIGLLESKIKEATDSIPADGHIFNTALAQSSQSTTMQAPFLALLEKTPRTPLLWLIGVSLDRWGDKVNSSTESFDTFANPPSGQELKAGLLENLVYKFASAKSFNALQHVELFVGSLDQQRTLISLVLPVVLFAFVMILSCSRSTKPALQASARTEEERQKQLAEKPIDHYFRTTHVSTGKMASDVACIHDNVVHFDIGQETDDIIDHDNPEHVRIYHIDVDGTFSGDKVEFFDVSDCESEVGSTCSNLSKDFTVPSCASDEPSSSESLTSLMAYADERRTSVMSVPGDICRACAERAPDMCRTCADSFEQGATLLPLSIRKQSEAMPPLPYRIQRLTNVEHPGIVTGTPGDFPLAVTHCVVEPDGVQGQHSQHNTAKDTDVDSEPEVTVLDPAPFPELSQSDLSSFDTQKSKGVDDGDGCEPIADPLKAVEAVPTLDSVWFGLSTVDLFMETLGWGAPRASSAVEGQTSRGYHVLDHLP